MTNYPAILLSLRPRFAQAILSGAKTVELRRRPVNARPDTPIILYASSPTMAIVGTARLRDVQVLTPDAAWQAHHRSLGLTRSEFDAYLDGTSRAHLLLLHRVCTLNEPLPLRTLRQEGRFQPPQSFRYVAASDPAPLHELIPATSRTRGDQGETRRPDTVRKPAASRSMRPASAPARTSPKRISHHRPTWTVADS